jgi:hypothetical protein
MNTSERIECIKSVTRQLSVEEWPIIDLTLRQLGLPWQDYWQGDKSSYVLTMIEKAPDQKLLELAAHLGLQETTSVLSEQNLNIWKPNHYRMFISHVSTCMQLATEVQEALRKYRVSSFVAHVDIEPVQEWMEVIELALRSCHALTALITQDFHLSKWTDQEMGVAMGRGLPVIPVRLGADPYGFIGKYQAIQGQDRAGGQIADDLLRVMIKNKQTAPRIATVLSEALLHSQSYKDSISVIDMLDEVQYADPGIVKNIQTAVTDNDQVYNTYVGKKRIEQILKRLESL